MQHKLPKGKKKKKTMEIHVRGACPDNFISKKIS